MSFLVTVSGWWAWNGFLSEVYSDNLSPYDIKGGFNNGFGRDPIWWLVLILAIAILVTIEVLLKSVQRTLTMANAWPLWKRKGKNGGRCVELDVGMWQEIERNPILHSRLGVMAYNDGEDDKTW